MEALRTGLLGVVALAVGVAGAFMHTWASPLGLVLSVGGAIALMTLCRAWLRSRWTIAVAATLWLVPVIVLAVERAEGDLVVQGDEAGMVLIFGGVASVGVGLGLGTADSRMRRFD